MKKFEELRNLALGNFGLVTSAQARKMGVRSFELSRWVKMSWLESAARGVYRLSAYPPSEYDPFAVAVESVGPEAVICGESVLGMLHLTDTNPTWIHVATSRRKRRMLSDGILLESIPAEAPTECYDGVRSEPVVDAIHRCIGRIMPERLLEAVDNGRNNGYLTETESRCLRREVDE